jgi:hypothetical protein
VAGDANQDGRFDQNDLAAVLQQGNYLSERFASWNEGDWNGDERFDQADIVFALQSAHYRDDMTAALRPVADLVAEDITASASVASTQQAISAVDVVFAGAAGEKGTQLFTPFKEYGRKATELSELLEKALAFLREAPGKIEVSVEAQRGETLRFCRADVEWHLVYAEHDGRGAPVTNAPVGIKVKAAQALPKLIEQLYAEQAARLEQVEAGLRALRTIPFLIRDGISESLKDEEGER